MKKLAILALALACGSAFANPAGDRCMELGLYAQAAAWNRNLGNTPQVAYAALRGVPIGDYGPMDDSALKSLINEVYFSHALERTTAAQVFDAYFGLCTGRIKPMVPLK
jgi:hypothetical protein